MGDSDLFEIGEVIAGNYQIRSILGEGGMGRVYAAHDILLNRKVALKASRPKFDRSILLKEAQALAAVKHPGTIEVYAAGEHRGVPFFVMEHLFGVDLATFLDRRKAEAGGPLPLDEALDILIPIAEALGAVHQSGIAHRDVKPANVMLTPSGRIVLMDFGLFQPESDAKPIHSGTPEYMAPEALLEQVDPRNAFLVDVYALGITAYELLAGDPPFVGASAVETVTKQLKSAPTDLRQARAEIPPRLAALVHEMLAKDPHERPPGMEAVLYRLRGVRDALTNTIPPPPRDDRFRVLVVDDDTVLGKLLGMYVTRAVEGAALVIVDRADAALAAVREHPPNVLVLDLYMPGMNGIELCTVLRSMRLADDVAIIPVSAGATEGDLEALRQLGISRFVAKGADIGAKLVPELRALHEQWKAAHAASPARRVTGPTPRTGSGPQSGKIRTASSPSIRTGSGPQSARIRAAKEVQLAIPSDDDEKKEDGPAES